MNYKLCVEIKSIKTMENNMVLLGGRRVVKPEDIAYLMGDLNYTQIFFCDNSKFLSSTTLKILEDRLLQYGFFRTHKSSLINLKFIKTFEILPKKSIISLKNEEVILVSRRKNKIIKNILTA